MNNAVLKAVNSNVDAAASRTPRPVFFGDAGTDALWDIVSALTIELSAARARIDTLERVLDQQKLIQKAALDQWVPDAAAAQERTHATQEFFGRVYHTLTQK